MVMVAVAGIGYACRWMRQWRCSRQIINPIQEISRQNNCHVEALLHLPAVSRQLSVRRTEACWVAAATTTMVAAASVSISLV